MEDVLEAKKRLDSSNTASNRRNLIRTCLSGIEGMLWFLKVQVFERRRTVRSVSRIELDAIFERSYSTNENGVVREAPRFLTTLTTIKLLAKVIHRDYPTFAPDFSDIGWDRVQKAIEIRNRITHPKSIDDLDVSIDDAENAQAAFFWTVAFVLRAVAHGAFG